MMPLYDLWSPHLVAPRTLRAYLTEHESLFTADGTDALIAAACAACGAGVPATWAWRALRTQYFSSYRDDPGSWRDAWNLAFEITVELREPPPPLAVPVTGALAIPEGDASYRHATPPDRSRLPCVVLADFRSAAAAEAAVALAPAGAVVVRGVGFGRFPSLAIDLGVRDEAFFAGGADDAEALVAALAAAGASVHQQQTLDWAIGRSR